MLVALALIGGTIYTSPSDSPLRDGVVLIDGSKIAAAGKRGAVRIPRSAQTLDCRGLTILAGFWNSHVHFFERKWANAARLPAPELARQIEDMTTRYGFTTVFDLGSDWENTRGIRDRIESGEIAGPRLRSTGPAIAPKNFGLPSDAVLGVLGVMKPAVQEVATGAEASLAIRNLLAAGVDGIKIFASGQKGVALPEGALAAAVEECRRAGKPLFVHPNNGADALAAIRAGVGILAHTTPFSGAWDPAIVVAARERDTALIPTLKIWMELMRHDRQSTLDKTAQTSTAQLRAWLDSGGTVLFGTDVSYANYDPAQEYALMAAAGMDFRRILTSLTTAPAARFGEQARLGRIAAGLEADLTVVAGDPAADLRALSVVRYTVRGGKVIYR